MELNLFSLKVFMKVVECDSISAAAKALFLSQPAVTMQIQNLEKHLAVSLFSRRPNGKLVLTDAGKTLYDHSEKIVDLTNDLLVTMESYTHKPLSETRLGACFVAGRYLVPLMLDTIKKHKPTFNVSITITRAKSIFDAISIGKLDIGIIGRDYQKKFFVGTELLSVPLTIFTGKQPNEKSKTLSLRDLKNIPMIAREEGAGCRQRFQDFLKEHKENIFHFRMLVESESIEAIKRLVKSGYGFGVLPDFMVRKDIQEGLFTEIHLQEGQPIQTFFVVHRKSHRLTKTQKEFLDTILESSVHLKNNLPIFGADL
mgnify:CR=1 FL=1